MTSATLDLWDVIAEGAAAESSLWAESLLPRDERQLEPVFSPLAPEPLRLAVETIYEGYLLHYGRPRLFAAVEPTTALLAGDYLYAHGLVRVAETGDVTAVGALAELISLCSALRADRLPGDGAAWAATAVTLGRGLPEEARAALLEERDPAPLLEAATAAAGADAVAVALAAHASRIDLN